MLKFEGVPVYIYILMPFKWSFLLQASQSRQTISISIDDLEGMRGQCLSWNTRVNQRGWRLCCWWVSLCQPIWCHSRSNVEKFTIYYTSCLVFANQLNNYAQVELDRLLNKWGFFTKLLGVSHHHLRSISTIFAGKIRGQITNKFKTGW